MLAANFMSKAMRLAPAVRSRASLAAFRSPVRPVRAPARAINTAAAQQAQAHSNTQQVPVQQQQQHGTQQQMPQQQQQAQQQSVARQQPQQQGGMARQQPQQQQQQGMAQQQPPQQRQPAGRRLQRVPLSAVLSPLDDFGPGFGRVGGFLRSIEDEMNSMMRAMEYSDNMTGGTSLSPSADAGQELAAPLQVDIHELEKEIVLQAGTPGRSGADVKVTYEPETRMLLIAGKRTSEHSETDEAGRFSRFERTFGAFQRRFKLPQNVDTGAISAKVNNGELEVRIPKTAATPKQQEIKVE